MKQFTINLATKEEEAGASVKDLQKIAEILEVSEAVAARIAITRL